MLVCLFSDISACQKAHVIHVLHLFFQVCDSQYNTGVCCELPHLKEHLQAPQAKEVRGACVVELMICTLYTILKKLMIEQCVSVPFLQQLFKIKMTGKL
jgi:hypothetical protein